MEVETMTKLFRICALAFFVMIIGVFGTMLYFYTYEILDVKKIPYDFSGISGYLAGYNLDPDKLHFGSAPAGVTLRRSITLTNNHDVPVVVDLSVSGSGAPYVAFETALFNLSINESRGVTIFVTPLAEGNLSGEIRATVRRHP